MSDTQARTALASALTDLSAQMHAIEDDLLGCLVIMGEPTAQQSVDGWVDQVVDVLRAADEVVDQHLTTLDRVSVRRDASHDGDLAQSVDDEAPAQPWKVVR